MTLCPRDVDLRMAHTESERKRKHPRNNNKAKTEQLKLIKTYPSI
jgi:hypothetical protein